MKRYSILAGTLAALFAAGLAAGILLAPDKGKRTRKRLLRRSKRLILSAGEAVAAGRDTLETLRDRLQENIEKLESDVSRVISCAKEKV